MNVNQLLHNHQLAKLMAQHADSRKDRDVNFDLVSHYTKQITAWRRAEGLSDTGWPQDERPCRSVNQ